MMRARFWVTATALALTGFGVAASDDDEREDREWRSAGQTVSVASGTALIDHPGRLLASNCFQCHGTNGQGAEFDSLAGESVSEILNEMREFRTKNEEEKAIMRVHALGYSDDEVRLLADYFARLGN